MLLNGLRSFPLSPLNRNIPQAQHSADSRGSHKARRNQENNEPDSALPTSQITLHIFMQNGTNQGLIRNTFFDCLGFDALQIIFQQP